MNLAVIFPGQGSQAVGMLQQLAAEYDIVKATFATASEVLGYDLWALVQAGPAADLNVTTKTQPALLAADVAVWRVWCAAGGARPTVVAGHSLGEYAALVAADVLGFRHAVELAALRGDLMQSAVPVGQGAMAAILGLAVSDVDQVCRQACQDDADGADDIVEAANFNAPGQVVIAGQSAAVKRAIEIAEARGAKRALLLPVSVPSHCRLMKPAAEKLAKRLAAVDLKAPDIPIIHNVDAARHQTADGIRDALTAQLYQPVRWVDTVQAMAAEGVTHMVELGPGRVLSGLGKRIDRPLDYLPVNDPASLNKAIATLQ